MGLGNLVSCSRTLQWKCFRRIIIYWPVEKFKLTENVAILKAVAQKLIPGVPIPTRISILQQTDADKAAAGEVPTKNTSTSASPKLSVLEQVIDNATSRNEIQQEIDGMNSLIHTS
jgi:hypothetical protein